MHTAHIILLTNTSTTHSCEVLVHNTYGNVMAIVHLQYIMLASLITCGRVSGVRPLTLVTATLPATQEVHTARFL